MATITLRDLNGLDPHPAKLSESTLIFVDYQNTYTQGVMELEGWKAALQAAAELLTQARKKGAKVIHVINDGGVGTPYDIRAEIGQIHPSVAALPNETVVIKSAPNAFVNTTLAQEVDAAGRSSLVIAGFMTHMCVTFTTEGAFLRGNKPTIVASACATRALSSVAGAVSAQQLHQSALATIADLYGVVVATPSELG